MHICLHTHCHCSLIHVCKTIILYFHVHMCIAGSSTVSSSFILLRQYEQDLKELVKTEFQEAKDGGNTQEMERFVCFTLYRLIFICHFKRCNWLCVAAHICKHPFHYVDPFVLKLHLVAAIKHDVTFAVGSLRYSRCLIFTRRD